jgi:hypothetical protein
MNMRHRFSQSLQLAFALLMLTLSTQVAAQTQGVGIDVPSPHPSAILDLDDAANERGLLVPGMSSTERAGIASPADGLLVYDTDQKMFYHYDGGISQWQAVNPFSYRKGASAADEDNFTIILTNNKSVVIGTVATPAEKLEVGGNIRATGTISSDILSSNSLNTSTSSITTLTSTTVNVTTINTNTVVAPGGTMTVTGNVAATGVFTGNGTIPIGGIIMWSGGAAPTGWQLCNGSNGTPDLRGRFIVGSGAGPGLTSYAVHNTGGVESSAHTHSIDPPNTTSSGTGGSNGVFAAHEDDGWPGTHTHDVNIDPFTSGGASANENRPPFYALAYIMRMN